MALNTGLDGAFEWSAMSRDFSGVDMNERDGEIGWDGMSIWWNEGVSKALSETGDNDAHSTEKERYEGRGGKKEEEEWVKKKRKERRWLFFWVDVFIPFAFGGGGAGWRNLRKRSLAG